MNYIYSDKRFTFVGYVDDGFYPEKAGVVDPIIEITNWPFDAFAINEDNCFVFADPNLMINSNFVNNEMVAERALVLRGSELYRHAVADGLSLVHRNVFGDGFKLEHKWHNLGTNHYLYRGNDLYEEIFSFIANIKDMAVTREYTVRKLNEFISKFVERIPFVHVFAINHATGEISRAYTARIENGKYAHLLKQKED